MNDQAHFPFDEDSASGLGEESNPASSAEGNSNPQVASTTADDTHQQARRHVRVPRPMDISERIDQEMDDLVERHIRHRIRDLKRKLKRQRKNRLRLEKKLEWVEFEVLALSTMLNMGRSSQAGGGSGVVARMYMADELRELSQLEPVLRVDVERAQEAEMDMREELRELRSRRDRRDGWMEPPPSGVEYFTVIVG